MEHPWTWYPWILVWAGAGVLQPIPCGYRGATVLWAMQVSLVEASPLKCWKMRAFCRGEDAAVSHLTISYLLPLWVWQPLPTAESSWAGTIWYNLLWISACSTVQLVLFEYMGRLQDGGGVRRGDQFPPHKYIKTTSTCGTTPTEHLLNAGRRPQTSQKDALRRPTHRGGAKSKSEPWELCEQRKEREISPSSPRSSGLNLHNQLDVPCICGIPE